MPLTEIGKKTKRQEERAEVVLDKVSDCKRVGTRMVKKKKRWESSCLIQISLKPLTLAYDPFYCDAD